MLILCDSIAIWISGLTLQQMSVISLLGIRLNISEEAADEDPLKVSDQLEVNVSCSLFFFSPKVTFLLELMYVISYRPSK